MTESPTSPGSLRGLLARFGALRPQPAAEWHGEGVLHPDLLRFYAEIGPYGEDGPAGPDGLTIPDFGNPYWLPPLCRLWDLQAGYRWDARSGRRLADWPEHWLVVAEQGGDPFILDSADGRVLHAHHGEGAWKPVPLFPDVFAVAAGLGTIGTVHEEAGETLLDPDFALRPAWRARLRERLAPILGAAEAEQVAARLGW